MAWPAGRSRLGRAPLSDTRSTAARSACTRASRAGPSGAAPPDLLAGWSWTEPSTFAVTGSSVDPAYWCPGGPNNEKYDLHATVNVHNGTRHEVSIQSVTAVMPLAAVQGSWLEKVGDRFD